MPEKKQRPAIRFKEFTDAWEQRKLSELLIERNSQAPKSIDYPLMAFIQNQGVAPKGERYDRSALVNDTENKLYKQTEYGDFIYSSNNLETGSIGLNKYGKACISPVYSIFSPTDMADSNFIGRRFIRKDFINEMIKWRQGVIYGQWRIHESDFLKINITVPALQEQQAIGSFLNKLDQLITLHQRKYEKLLTLKKSCLEKMFPKSENKNPEIRFKGFTDAWKQCKVSDVSDRYDNLRVPVAENLRIKGKTPYYGANGIQDYVEGYTHDGEYILVAEDGANDLKHYPVNYVNGRVWVNNHAHVLQAKKSLADNRFLGYAVSIADIESVLVGGGRAKLNADVLMNISLLLPKKDEQIRISSFISSLDNLITLYHRKLKMLQNIKKSCLEKMFV